MHVVCGDCGRGARIVGVDCGPGGAELILELVEWELDERSLEEWALDEWAPCRGVLGPLTLRAARPGTTEAMNTQPRGTEVGGRFSEPLNVKSPAQESLARDCTAWAAVILLPRPRVADCCAGCL